MIGRVNDQISIGGTKISAEAIDMTVQAVPGVVDVICFLQSGASMIEELAVVLSHETDRNAKEIAEDIRNAISTKFGPSRVPKRIYVSGAIPRNENGKPTRHLAAEAVKEIEPIS